MIEDLEAVLQRFALQHPCVLYPTRDRNQLICMMLTCKNVMNTYMVELSLQNYQVVTFIITCSCVVLSSPAKDQIWMIDLEKSGIRYQNNF